MTCSNGPWPDLNLGCHACMVCPIEIKSYNFYIYGRHIKTTSHQNALLAFPKVVVSCSLYLHRGKLFVV